MTVNFRLKVLAGAVALALGGGTAMANTSIDNTTVGNVFINVVDTTNNSSFLFDTGVSQASFNPAATQTFDFHTDPNYAAFVSAQGSNDVLDYSVMSATKIGSAPAVGTVLFTSNSGPGPVVGANIQQVITVVGGFALNANAVSSTTTNSALLGAATTWGQTAYEYTAATALGVVFSSPGTGIDALVGTPINFYDETSNALRSGSTNATLTPLAGTWNYSGGVATYSATQAVPLPTPLLLLLSGLALMGVVARRGKGTVAGTVAV